MPPSNLADLIWTGVGFLLTLFVLSYIFGDNGLFRFATSVFIGVSAGIVAVIIIFQVIYPKLVLPLFNTTNPILQVLQLVPITLCLLLIFKLSPRYSKIGTIPMAYLVGAASAVLVGGAISGTLFPQVSAVIQGFSINAAINVSPVIQLISALVVLIGTVTTLIYFQYSAHQKPGQPVQRGAVIEILAKIGQIFIAITLGALLAGIFTAALTALIERLGSMYSTITTTSKLFIK